MQSEVKKKCETSFCSGKRSGRHKHCPKCRHRQHKAKDYVRYVYNYWRCNCKRRGRDNTVTLEQFRIFVKQTGYIEGKGKKKYSLCIDRIDNTRGYHIDNIRTITLSANSYKRNKEDEAYCPF